MDRNCFGGCSSHSDHGRLRCLRAKLAALWMAGLVLLAGCAGTPNPADSAGQVKRAELEHRARLADADSAYRMGAAAMNAGDLARAQRRFQEATELNPYHGAAHNDLGVVHFRQGDLYQAAVQFDTAAKNLVDRHEPFFNLGLVMEKGGLLTKAAEAYRNALELAPEDLPTMRALARTQVKRGAGGAETARLIERALLRETAPQWRRWLRRQLIRLRGMEPTNAPAPKPSEACPQP